MAWSDFVRFIRQLSHDLRNQLNAAELQAMLVNELSQDPELKGELRRLRELVSRLGTTLQTLSSQLTEPQPTTMDYPAADLIADLRKRVGQSFPGQAEQLDWPEAIPAVILHIDPMLVSAAVLELIENAFRHRNGEEQIRLATEINGDRFILTLREPKAALIDESLLSIPLRSSSHGHYALGRRRVREILRRQGGALETTAQSDTLTSRIVLPCFPEVR